MNILLRQAFGPAFVISTSCLAVLASTLCTGNAHAQAKRSSLSNAIVQDQEPNFLLPGFDVEGPELVPRSEVFSVLAAFAGRSINFTELRNATAAVEHLHAEAGFEVVRVLVPEQDIAPGQNLKLVIVDARLDMVNVTGNNHFSTDGIKKGLPVLQAGALINTIEMDKNLRLLNDNSSRIVRVELEPSDKPGRVDANVKVADQDPLAFFVTLDNTGTNATGDFRLGLAAQHNDIFGIGHSVLAQYVTSPGHWSDVDVFSLSYKAPVPRYNSLFEFSYSDSNVNAGNLGVGTSSVSVSGAGTAVALKWTYLLDRLLGFDQRFTLSQELKQFTSQVLLNGTGSSLVPNLESRPTGLTYSLVEEKETRQRALSLSYFKNYVTGGENSTAQYALSSTAAKANFDLFKFSSSWSDQLWDNWRFTAQLDGQYSKDTLISGEQFGAGGIYSVRGFEERVISADAGLRQSLEFLSPNLATRVGPVFERLQVAAFAEAAQLRVNAATNGTPSEPHLSSFGAGLRFAFAPRQQFRLDLARVVSGVPVQPHGDVMLPFTFAAAL